MGKRSKRPRQAHKNHHHHDFSFSPVKKNFSAGGHRLLSKGSSPSSASKKLTNSGKKQQQQLPHHHVHHHQVKKKKSEKTKKPLTIPFRPSDHILFVGEGDFSFALSLVEHHKCSHITATCYDSETVLHEKYPRAREILDRLLSHGSNHGSGAARDLEPDETIEAAEGTGGGGGGHSEWEGLSPSPSSSASNDFRPSRDSPSASVTDGSRSIIPRHSTPAGGNISFHASISAHSLSRCKPIRRRAPYHKIVFNFPHVGGLSTDVNRQVRANQELLVAFFKSCRPLLASRSNPVPSDRSQVPAESPLARGEHDDNEDDDNDEDNDSSIIQDRKESRSDPTDGQVIISLFDGEPYSLWNIRDLARHSGYRLVTSWRFPWEAYPGYRHARTAGEIFRKGGDECAAVPGSAAEADGKAQAHTRKGGPWKGEEREARGYVFEMVADDYHDDQAGVVHPPAATKMASDQARATTTKVVTRNKKREISSSSSSSESESDG